MIKDAHWKPEMTETPFTAARKRMLLAKYLSELMLETGKAGA